MNHAAVLAVSAGIAIALQVVANSIGMKVLGLGALIGVSGAVTAVAGFAAALFLSRPEASGKALLAAVVSGLLGAFILAAIVLAANSGGLARTLSLVIGTQLAFGIAIDRIGIFGPAAQEFGAAKSLGMALILFGGLLLVHEG
ncbi:MAG: DMT family transporter [Actinomycetota bacterium]